MEMEKTFKSKIGLELVIPLSVLLGAILFMTVSEKPSWLGLAILLPTLFFIVHLFMTTHYKIDGDNLTIKSGFFYTKTLSIHTIKKISETNSILSSPATSIDRIEITFGKFDSVLISPLKKKEFIGKLISINPRIEVNYKKKKSSGIKS